MQNGHTHEWQAGNKFVGYWLNRCSYNIFVFSPKRIVSYLYSNGMPDLRKNFLDKTA